MVDSPIPRRFSAVTERVTRLEERHEAFEDRVDDKFGQVLVKMDAFLKLGERVVALETARAVQRAWVAGAACAGTALGGALGWALSHLIHIPG